MELPLLTRAREGGDAFLLTGVPDEATPAAASFCGAGSMSRVPQRPGPGEQYRFHFDMTKCIGCKCCVVACNEQNGNPADILWRRVGEIEGGTYPQTHRHYLSMGCNHCLEPTCMTGCPVDAYSKDSLTGIVRHSASACIGCQYCTWNCSYGVPQFNTERGVVGKCDMCYGRLMHGQEPACAAACPEDAIAIEVVRIADWREQFEVSANSPGMPPADDSISTTRITLPKRMPTDVQRVDLGHLRPEHPHWSLIAMTVLTQFSVGSLAAIWILQTWSAQVHRSAALVATLVAGVALAASTLHLGRPIYAMRALKMWRRSWLSREVLLFTLFAGFAVMYAATVWIGARESGALGAFTVLLGVAGVCASARLYLVPGRPAWNSPLTIAEFLSTAAMLGASAAIGLTRAAHGAPLVFFAASAATLITAAAKAARVRFSEVHELHGTWQLLTTIFQTQFALRFLLIAAGWMLVAFVEQTWARAAIVATTLAAEFLGRYLFFVTVVARNMASGYLAQEAA